MTVDRLASIAAPRTSPVGWLRVGKGYAQTSESLAVYRIAFALIALFVLGPTRIGVGGTSQEVGGLPGGMYHPPLGPAMLLDGWPSATVLLLLEALLVAALGAILIGAYTRTASLTAAACGLILTSLLYSEGKVDHAFLWAVLVPAAMAWSSWGDTWSVDAGRYRVRARKGFRADSVIPIKVVAVALGVMFAAAAAVKAVTGWLEPGTSSILGWAFAHGIQTGSGATPPPLLSSIPEVVWLALDFATVIFEAGFLIAAMRRHWLIPYLVVGAAFHLSAGFVGFPAFFDIVLVYLLFIRLDAVANLLHRPLDKLNDVARRQPGAIGGAVAIMLAVYFVVAVILDGPLTVARILGFVGVPFSALWLLILVAVFVIWLKRSPPEDRPGNALPGWAFPAAAVFLAAQTALTLAVSEPYPSLAGPLFMGNFDDGKTINIVEQQFVIVNDGEAVDVAKTDVLAMSKGGATQLGAVRFPAPFLDSSGNVIDNPSNQQRLANQYHHFSSKHLPDYAGGLSDAEKTWIRGNLAEQGVSCEVECVLEVRWKHLSFDRSTGEQIASETVSRESYPIS